MSSLSKGKKKGKRLTVNEVKQTIYQEIEKKELAVDPNIHNMRIVEDNLTELETTQFILAIITDEERRREREGQMT